MTTNENPLPRPRLDPACLAGVPVANLGAGSIRATAEDEARA